jgi:hypothetical protein
VRPSKKCIARRIPRTYAGKKCTPPSHHFKTPSTKYPTPTHTVLTYLPPTTFYCRARDTKMLDRLSRNALSPLFCMSDLMRFFWQSAPTINRNDPMDQSPPRFPPIPPPGSRCQSHHPGLTVTPQPSSIPYRPEVTASSSSSRRRVEEILRGSGVPLTALRASIIVGNPLPCV